MAGEAGGEHAVEQVDARGRRPRRSRSGRPGPSGSAAGRRAGAAGWPPASSSMAVAGLAHRQPADRVAVEADRERALGALQPQRRRPCRPARCRTGSGRAAPRRGRPAGRAPPRPRCGRRRPAARPAGTAAARTRRAPSGCRRPSWRLDRDGRLRGEPVGASVVGGPEGDAVVVDGTLPPGSSEKIW